MYTESKRFIEEHIDLIDQNNFSDFYTQTEGLEWQYIGGITQILIQCGINPLSYIDYIPAAYLYDVCTEQTFTIPNNIRVIDQVAFCGTTLEEINIPEGIKVIEVQAFAWNEDLIKVTLPKSLQQIEVDAFEGCINLHEIYYNGTKEEFRKIECSSKLINSFDSSRNTLSKIQCADGEIKL